MDSRFRGNDKMRQLLFRNGTGTSLNLARGILFLIFSLDAYAAFLNSGIKRFSDVEHRISDVVEQIE